MLTTLIFAMLMTCLVWSVIVAPVLATLTDEKLGLWLAPFRRIRVWVVIGPSAPLRAGSR